MSKKAYEPDTTEYPPDSAVEIYTTQVAQEAPLQEAPPQTSTPARLIYVGPNVPGGILHRFQVFKGGFPPYCKDLFEKVPELREFFVPVEGLEAVRRKIDESGTNEARLFYIAQQKLSKGVK